MKYLSEFLSQQGYLFKKLIKISPKELGSRKKIEIFDGLDISNIYVSIFIVDQKSRLVTKDINTLISLHNKLIQYLQHNFKDKILLLNAPICSKATKLLQEQKWQILPYKKV